MNFQSPYRLNSRNLMNKNYSNEYFKKFRHNMGVYSEQKQFNRALANQSTGFKTPSHNFYNNKFNYSSYNDIFRNRNKYINKDYDKIYQNGNIFSRLFYNLIYYKNCKNKIF